VGRGLRAPGGPPVLYWAINDGGNPTRRMLIKPDGSRVRSFNTPGASNTDWEDIDAFDLDGKHYLLVADTGDNGGIRETLTLFVFEEPATVKDGADIAPAWTIEFRWPDGARDCEASAVDAARGEVLLVSKKRVPPELFRVVMNYHSVYFYVRQPGETWAATMTRNPGSLRFPWLPQAEAVAFSVDGSTLLIGGEQRPTPLFRFSIKK